MQVQQLLCISNDDACATVKSSTLVCVVSAPLKTTGVVLVSSGGADKLAYSGRGACERAIRDGVF